MITTYKKLGLLALMAFCVLLAAGCNETLRQFIVPVPKPTGDPNLLAHAVVLSTNPAPASNGSTMNIDVSGDTVAGVFDTGPNPVFLGKTSGRVFVINGDDTITSYTAPFLSTPTLSTITLPSSGATAATTPVAGATTSTGNFFLANMGSDNSSVISAGVLAQTQTIAFPAGSHPVAIAGNSGNSKMYVVNNGTNNVTVVSTIDNSILGTITVGSHPIWGVMAKNGVQVFILNQGDGTATNPGSVSVIDTNLDIVIPCTPGPACNAATGAISVGTTPATSSPNFAFYDAKLQRLYVTDTGESTVSVIKADGINLGVTPQVLPGLLANITVASAPTSVVALSDGSKAYAALGGCPTGTNHTNLLTSLASCTGGTVSVIDATALQQIGTIGVGTGAGAVSIDASPDASRVYVVGAHTGNVSIIRTSTDQVTTTFSVPQQDSTCKSSCSLQVPFAVRVFP